MEKRFKANTSEELDSHISILRDEGFRLFAVCFTCMSVLAKRKDRSIIDYHIVKLAIAIHDPRHTTMVDEVALID